MKMKIIIGRFDLRNSILMEKFTIMPSQTALALAFSAVQLLSTIQNWSARTIDMHNHAMDIRQHDN